MTGFDPVVASEVSQWATQNLGQSYIKIALDLDRKKAGDAAAKRSFRALTEKAAREYGKFAGGAPDKADVEAALDYVVEAYLTHQDDDYGGARLERLVEKRRTNPGGAAGGRFYVIEKDPGEYYVADGNNEVRLMGGFGEAEANRIADSYNKKGTVLRVANPQVREGSVVGESISNPAGDQEDYAAHELMYDAETALDRNGHYRHLLESGDWLSIRMHDDGDMTAKVGEGVEVIVPVGQLQDVLHYALHQGTLDGWQEDSEGYSPEEGELADIGNIIEETRHGNPRQHESVVQTIAQQLVYSGLPRRSVSFVAWDANTLKVAKGLRGALIKYNRGTDLYDVTPYDASGPGARSPLMSAAGVGDPGAGAIWGDTVEGVGFEELRQVVEPMLRERSGNPLSGYDRKRMLEFLWRETPKSNRSGRGAGRMVMVRGAGGSALAPLDSLTDEEIETALGLRTGESRVGNPADEAAAKYTEFHGRAPRETLEIHEEVHTHSHLAALGALTRIKVNCESGARATIDFSAGDAEDERPVLATSEDGRQLYIRGGDQSLDLAAIGMDGSEWVRDSMCIGEVTDVEYQTEKGFDNFDLVTYFHRLGEESKVRPYLVYDTVNQLLSIVGGQYEIKPEGIVN